ncbi:MAG TPA: GldG family protein [Anaerohalosphaeraceae bacterium]|nr:GldG family protein [Phycisphaerae bacterium]HOK96088.1 GldG family protein [Anaerohalosphaeraceae bacterium]HOL31525.1 GldG family protein [Anaerohalosphaeraceae bacterium]HPC64366.1 GldG family protein [Anaerohalosphaeraceae bacterium]HPO69595.1 GldG family protein [Anaerohalosphaeraceae bacterium]
MNRMMRTVLGIFFAAVIAVSAIWIIQNLGRQLRLDITERKLYTLSQGTKEILADLKQPISMKLFYTKTAAMKAPDQIRFYNNYFTYVKALLEEYQAQSNGKIKLDVIDPRPYSDEELAAIRYGLRRFNITEDESFFFGLVVQTQFGVTKIIDFFSPDRQEFVEYDISYLIDTAVTRQKKRLGVLSSLPVMGDSEYMIRMMQMQGQQGRRKWGIISHLEKQFEVTSIPADAGEITDVDLLLVIHPKDLSEKTQFAIDQFVLKGGRAIICVDPHSIADAPDMQQQFAGGHRSASGLPRLLKAWGLEMPEMKFAGDRVLAVTGSPNPAQRPEKILSIMRLSASEKCFNRDHPISAQLNEVTVVFPGVLNVLEADAEEPKLEHIPLLMTSARGNVWSVSSPYELMSPDYRKFMQDFRDGDKPVVIGYFVSGNFKSAFPDGIEVAEENTDESGKEEQSGQEESDKPKMKKITGLTQAEQPCAVVVLADVDLLCDMVAYQRTFFGLAAMGDNSSLILNTLENLCGSSRLISIRSRGNYKRPFVVVDQIEAKADAETAEEEAAITAQIKGFEQQLNEKLRSLEGENKGELINQTILKEKQQIELKLHEAEKRLREVKMRKREQIEKLKERMRFYCTIPGPILTLVIAVVLGISRAVKRRRYISHASDA